MCFEKVKETINQSPFLSKILQPLIITFRRARSILFRLRLKHFRIQLRRLSRFPEAIFVKVGANDGISNDPCSDILLENTNWKGLLIEPVPYCCERLKTNFSDTSRFAIEQVAIGATPGKSSFYYVNREALESLPSLPYWYDQLGSFNKKHILDYLGEAIEPFIVKSEVETCTLSDVLKKNRIGDLHLLHIDTEGYDFEVLKMLDFTNYSPVIIFIEHKHLSNAEKSAMLCLLRDNGYSVYNCGTDYYALNKTANNRLHGTRNKWRVP